MFRLSWEGWSIKTCVIPKFSTIMEPWADTEGFIDTD